MKQTAVEWFESMLKNWDVLLPEIKKAIIEQAKEMEKEQITEAYRTGVEEDVYNNPLKTGEQYYEQTFK